MVSSYDIYTTLLTCTLIYWCIGACVSIYKVTLKNGIIKCFGFRSFYFVFLFILVAFSAEACKLRTVCVILPIKFFLISNFSCHTHTRQNA